MMNGRGGAEMADNSLTAWSMPMRLCPSWLDAATTSLVRT